MKVYLYIIAFSFFVFSCEKKSKIEQAVEEIPIELQVARFDKAFFETPPADLPKLKVQYPFLFPEGNDDKVWLEKMQNPQWLELYAEVQNKYSNFDAQTTQIEELFKHIKYYYPKTKSPKIITLISEMDYQNKVIYADSLLLVSLEMYLGKEHKFYEFPEYIKQNFETNQILPDIVSSYALRKIPPPTDNTFIGYMIYAGKELYLKDQLLPALSDDVKIGYTPEQLAFCQENESFMWRFFIEEKLLFDSDQKLVPRFINPAPFSKFYLEIDNQTPGRVGAWIGWQIVRSYMQNNPTSLQEMLVMDSKEIFEKSRYKPKK
jgi:gliding motility-associated lipoprotein GldB